MKKINILLISCCLVFSLCGCNKNNGVIEEKEKYTLGVGSILSLDNTADLNAQVDLLCASVVLDENGQIIFCCIDATENKVLLTDGKIGSGIFKSNMELGVDYQDSSWYQQVHAFETFILGKSIVEVQALETQEIDGKVVAKDEALYASCKLDISSLIEIVVKAGSDEFAVKFNKEEDIKLGLALYSYINHDESKDSENNDGVIVIETVIGSCVVSSNGKVKAAINDMVKPLIYFNNQGNIKQAKFEASNRELKEKAFTGKV